MSEIVNIVAVTRVILKNTQQSLPDLLNLDKHKLRNKRSYLSEFKTKREMNQFSGFFLKLKSATLTIFKTGRIVINGIKEWTKIVAINDEFTHHLCINLPPEIEFELELPRIVNITGCRHTRKNIDLIAVVKNDSNAKYEPEIFPNLQYRFNNSSARGIISKKGSIIVTGIKRIDEIKTHLDELENKCKNENQ
ncbi:uncharacterized protein LOC141851637 [Brevipalpus obovatus]|uniref:uncharacterized protein LOC141851637 n=1 Tax=Brevipalpus obovatus TaxID=246614 RepID=UPI003D9DDA28